MARTTISSAVGWIELHRPRKLNALSAAFAGACDAAERKDRMTPSAQTPRRRFSDR